MMSEPTTVTAKRLMQLIETQGYRCALSGRPLTPETASIDHIVPVARGGTHDMSNVWIVDHRVNLAKGVMTTEEFVAMCREVVEYQNGKSQRHGAPDAPKEII